MTAHICPECSLIHDALEPRTSDAVEIARIEAEARIAEARINASAARGVAELQADAATDIADTEADAQVETAAAVAEVIESSGSDNGDVPPAVVLAAPELGDTGDDAEPDDMPPPGDGSPVPEPPSPSKRRGLGMW